MEVTHRLVNNSETNNDSQSENGKTALSNLEQILMWREACIYGAVKTITE
jgi:hypothetical protein